MGSIPPAFLLNADSSNTYKQLCTFHVPFFCFLFVANWLRIFSY